MIAPGRIVVVDDVAAEVSKLVEKLRDAGEDVYYTKGYIDDKCAINTRILITDYLLDGELDSSLEAIVGIIRKIHEITQFFIVVIWSKHVGKYSGEVMVKSIQNRYKGEYGEELKIAIIPALQKGVIEYDELITKISEYIGSNHELGLLYEYEKLLYYAKDNFMSDLNSKGDAEPLLKSLRAEVGDSSISRVVLNLYSNIFKRYIKPSERFNEFIKQILNKQSNANYDGYGKFHFLISYYYTMEEEIVWTGDILYDKELEEYCIVITPECDFAKNKVKYINIIYAERIDHESFKDEKKVEEIKKKYGLKIKKTQLASSILKDVNLPDRYKTICYLRGKNKEEIFHLIIKFQQTKSIPYIKNISDNPNFERLCRIDKPLISQIQQDYGKFCSRIGTINVPRKVANSVRY